MRAKDKSTGDIVDVKPYYLYGRVVAFTGVRNMFGPQHLPGIKKKHLEFGNYAWLPDELELDLTEFERDEKGFDKED